MKRFPPNYLIRSNILYQKSSLLVSKLKYQTIKYSIIARNEGHAPALYSGFLHENWIPRAFYPAAFSLVIKNNMAFSSKRSRENVDYRQLHYFRV